MIEIILAVISLLFAILNLVVVPYFKSKTTAQQRENIYIVTKMAVMAAEQIFLKPGQGQQKKEYVIDYLYARGIKLTIEELDMIIEAAVKELQLIQR